jgi:type I restriction enzyme, S subunit
MKKYSKYKNTNIEWIGEIPEHWGIKPLKYLAKYEKGKNATKFTKEFCSQNHGEYPVYSGQTQDNGVLGFINEADYAIDKGILVTTVGAKAMSTRVVSGEFSLSQNCALIQKKTSELDTNYLYYQLGRVFAYEKDLLANIMQPSLRFEDLDKYKVVVPSASEQTQISSYLDNKTSLIDKLINNNKKLIKLLEEKRTALINKVITKGLDPNVKMKDSGIEWIGEIPEHWEVGKLSVFSKRLGVGLATSVTSSYRKDGIPLLRNQNIKVNHFDDRDLKFLDREFAERNISKAVFGNDVIVVHTGSHIGRATVVPMKYHLAHTFTTLIITPKDYLDSRFLMYTINSKLGISQIDNLQVGIGKNNLNVQQFKDFILPLPPKNEQEEITYVLDKSNKMFDQQVVNIKSENSLLKEYRQSLISNVVTGKIKVANL